MKPLNNETIKTSVLIITRNRSKMLEGCLESLVKQTRMPDELIVVDNASTDNTKRVVLSFNKKLPVKYVQEKQIGIPYARNKGIKTARGTIILMLDDDCVADKFWVEKMINAHKKYPKAWVIQGRTYSLPPKKICSVLAEYHRSFHFRNSIKNPLPMRIFFSKGLRDEVELLTCNTQNFSIKALYLKKHKLLFDENFYRGSDTDFGKQIMQKNGLIMFCPGIQIYHWERCTLNQFLEQRWHTGRTTAKISYKWKTSTFAENMLSPRMPFALLLFCRASNQLTNLPILLVLLFLDRLYRLNGYFYQKRLLSLEKPKV